MSRIVLFTRTAGYRHEESIQLGVGMIEKTAAAADVDIVHTEDAASFADALDDADAAVWFQVSGDVLDQAQREKFAAFLRSGGGFAGIHGAADAEWSWPEYDDILGARFLYHPENGTQQADIHVRIAEHPSTAHLPSPWSWTEEWYAFQRNPRGTKHILLTVDELTYDVQEQSMGLDHPISWAGSYGEGRTWFSALGHHPESYSDPLFIQHIWGGISSVLRT